MPRKPTIKKPTFHANITTGDPNKKIKNNLSFEVILFDELCMQFKNAKGWKYPHRNNPFLERKATPFDVVSKVGNQESGCEVTKENETTKFALIGTDKASLSALHKCVMAYRTACTRWQNLSPENKNTDISYSLTVDDLEEIKPILQALEGVCSIKAYYVRDENDPDKTTPVSAEKMKEILAEIKKDEEKGQRHASKNPQNAQKKKVVRDDPPSARTRSKVKASN